MPDNTPAEQPKPHVHHYSQETREDQGGGKVKITKRCACGKSYSFYAKRQS